MAGESVRCDNFFLLERVTVKPTIGIIIQARTGSKRLPNKMILAFHKSYGLFETVLRRISKYPINLPVILATTISAEDDILVEIARKNGLEVFRGDEDDVLNRFIGAAENYEINKIIRVCADNPFIDLPMLLDLSEKFSRSRASYFGYTIDGFLPTIKTGVGFWAEGVTLSALKNIQSRTSEPMYLEHVTNYLYENPEKFKIHLEKVDNRLQTFSDIRLTVDTAQDFELSKKIYEICFEKNNRFQMKDVLKEISIHSEWRVIMKEESDKNKK